MKKYFLFLFVIFGVVFMLNSCNNADIVGKWKFEKTTADVVTSDENTTAKILAEMVRHADQGVDKSHILEFTDDGKMKNNKGESVDYSVSGNKLISKTMDSDGEAEFQIQGDTLILFEDVTTHLDEIMREKLDIDKDIKIEKIVVKVHLTRQ